jgi:phosphinothricin acetyltransferase
MLATDWTKVAAIYKQGIDTGNATFQQKVPTWNEWNEAHLVNCRIVAVIDNEVVGWAALSEVSGRCVYAGVGEVSIYVSNDNKGQKIGFQLLRQLITESENEGFWTLQSGIFPENIASLKIHDHLGFRQVGFRERIGKMNNKWRNTILLERRSNKVGLE